MSRLGNALRVVVLCAIVAYAYKCHTSKKNVSKTPHPNIGVLAAPKRTLRKIYSSSLATREHAAAMQSMARQFTDSLYTNKPKWENLIFIGDVYARGKFPFLLPNENMALTCYRVAAGCPCSAVHATARSRVVEMNRSTLDKSDRAGNDMPTRYGADVCNAAARYISETRPPRDEITLRPETSTPSRAADIPPYRLPPRAPARRTNPLTRRYRNIGGGSQNTHDHGVVTATKLKINRLKDEYSEYEFRDHATVVDETMNLCRRVVEDPESAGVPKESLNDVFEVTTSLTSDEFSDTGLTQIQILDLTLNKIQSLHEDVSKGVQETLCKRMATAIEDGKTVCATGKLARIVSVFEGVLENSQNAVSIAYVEREIAHMAAKVRDDFLQRAGPVARQAYESSQCVPEYGTTMANTLKQRATEEYVDKLNMAPTIIEPLVELYSSSF